MKTAGGDRHQPWRAHLPRRDRRARARRAGGGRRGGRDGAARDRARRVTVSCAERRSRARSTRAALPFEVDRVDAAQRCRVPRTAIMVNLGNPDLAFRTAMLPNDGRRPGAHGVHHQRAYRRPSDGAGAPEQGHLGRRRGRRSQRLTRQLRATDRILRPRSWPRASARSPPRSIRSR